LPIGEREYIFPADSQSGTAGRRKKYLEQIFIAAIFS
jgi:hypothetical protein